MSDIAFGFFVLLVLAGISTLVFYTFPIAAIWAILYPGVAMGTAYTVISIYALVAILAGFVGATISSDV